MAVVVETVLIAVIAIVIVVAVVDNVVAIFARGGVGFAPDSGSCAAAVVENDFAGAVGVYRIVSAWYENLTSSAPPPLLPWWVGRLGSGQGRELVGDTHLLQDTLGPFLLVEKRAGRRKERKCGCV